MASSSMTALNSQRHQFVKPAPARQSSKVCAFHRHVELQREVPVVLCAPLGSKHLIARPMLNPATTSASLGRTAAFEDARSVADASATAYYGGGASGSGRRDPLGAYPATATVQTDAAVAPPPARARASMPAPLSIPAPVGQVCVERLVPGRPEEVVQLLFGQSSEFRKGAMAKEGLRDIVVGSWIPVPSAAMRTVTYIRPLSIPIPLAPKQCNVTEVDTMLAKEAQGYVLESKIMTDAPKGDAFHVIIQHVGTLDPATGYTRVRMSCGVTFVKSMGFLRGLVESTAISSTKQLLGNLVDDLVEYMSSRSGSYQPM